MTEPDEPEQQPDPGDRRFTDLAALLGVLALIALMVYVAHSLSHASHQLDCASVGTRNCR